MSEINDDGLTPSELVGELDRYIIGQHEAKRAVAIAIRNRWRRKQLAPELRDEVLPKNIIMIGPTGVGKTEIARRLASLVKAPFIKVEASKYTEVGYVGRDVESMIRDLVSVAISMVTEEQRKVVSEVAASRAHDRLIELLMASRDAEAPASEGVTVEGFEINGQTLTEQDVQRVREGRARERLETASTREAIAAQLRAGQLDALEVEFESTGPRQMPQIEVFSSAGVEQMGLDFQELFERIMPGGQQKSTRMTVAEARELFEQEEADKLIDRDKAQREALERVSQNGIVFIDELDKIAGGQQARQGPDVSREGVQRDLLPIVEGSTVNTRYGMVNTDHILFISAGAFHVARPSDLIPELQGRFPIRVELSSLSEEDFRRILTEPQNSLVRQYTALLETEGVELVFTEDGITEIARVSAEVNRNTQNIGARRLATVMEKILEEISFDAPTLAGGRQVIDRNLVRERLEDILADEDLSRYIL